MSSNIDKILEDLNSAIKSGGNQQNIPGIRSTATREQMIISDQGVHIGELKVEKIISPLRAIQAEIPNINASGYSEFNNLSVTGKLTAETLQVKKLITDQSEDVFTKSILFKVLDPNDLDGKGLLWHSPGLTHQFVFKPSQRSIFSSESINLYRNSKYKIDGIDILDFDRLGSSVQISNLKKVGVLDDLKVRGSVELGDTLFLNPALGRIGINTDQPKAALNISDSLVDVVAGVNENSTAFFGTWSNHQLDIITDNTRRISINGSTVEIGSAQSKNALVKIHGSLEVEKIVSDLRVEKTSSIVFLPEADKGIYAKGLLWKEGTAEKKFLLLASPDRLYSSESLDLATGRSYFINNKVVLSDGVLGETVTDSSLTKLGILNSLIVDGDVNLSNCLLINDHQITAATTFSVTDQIGSVTVKGNGINVENQGFDINVNGAPKISIDVEGNVSLGSKQNTNRNVRVYGQLSVNITNPEPGTALAIGGDISVNGKKFANGENIPTTGSWKKGDIVWNSNPQEASYIGWVCLSDGSPGIWKPFGYIGER